MTAHATVHRAPGCSGLFIPKGGQTWNDHIIDEKRQSQRLIGAAILGQLTSLTKAAKFSRNRACWEKAMTESRVKRRLGSQSGNSAGAKNRFLERSAFVH